MTLNSISGTHCTHRGNTKKKGSNGSGQSIGYSVGNAKKLGQRIKKGLIGLWQQGLERLEFDAGEEDFGEEI